MGESILKLFTRRDSKNIPKSYKEFKENCREDCRKLTRELSAVIDTKSSCLRMLENIFIAEIPTQIEIVGGTRN